MHSHSMHNWTHDHVFLGRDHDRNERRTWLVVALTAVMMVVEIAAGVIFGSMALLADGLHMMTHAGALAIAALAYVYARRHARDPSFTFGTGKVGDLASFASAIVLAMVALAVAYESAIRLYAPVAMPVTRERQFMKPEITARSGLRPSIRTSKRPHCHAVLRRPSSIRASASGGSTVSACRNSSTSPLAAAAPSFICAPRPRGASITRSASGLAIATVRSRLPPSPTITSAPRSR